MDELSGDEQGDSWRRTFVARPAYGRLCALSVVLLLTSCSSEPFEYMPVSGTIAYEDGAPLPASGLQLRFDSMDAKPVGEFHPLPGKASVDAAGAFSLATTHKYGDGLIPGKHKVSLAYATDAKGELLVPQDYTHPSTTPLVVDTGDGKIDIKVPRP